MSKIPQKYLDMMSKIQDNLLEFIDDEANEEENFQNLTFLFNEQKIRENINYLKSLLHLLVNVANNHFRGTNFFDKIEKIIRYFQNEIKKYYSNSEIYDIFKSNRRILLFIIEEKMMIIDKIMLGLSSPMSNYSDYLAPEIEPINNNKQSRSKFSFFYKKPKEIDSKSFYEDRKIGENPDYICKLIRDDSVEEFITYVNKNNYPLNSIITYSIFETNPYLISESCKKAYGTKKDAKNGISLIEYSTFYGSIQIFNYLRMNGVELTPSLWTYTIHGKNAEIIHLLEENHIEPEDNTYQECLEESIKCHHNDFAHYFQDNYIRNQDDFLENENGYLHKLFILALKYHNFALISNDFINPASFFELCKYDYCSLVDILLKGNDVNVNEIRIFTQISLFN